MTKLMDIFRDYGKAPKKLKVFVGQGSQRKGWYYCPEFAGYQMEYIDRSFS
jgi:hypothetical protein